LRCSRRKFEPENAAGEGRIWATLQGELWNL